MSSYCHLYLNTPQRGFAAGDLIEGKLKCYFRNDKNTRGIKLKIKGKEHTDWNEQESYYDSNEKTTRSRTVNYSGDHRILYNLIHLCGGGTIQSGHHEYPFSYRLPSNIPSTFKNQYGYIRYFIKATVDIPWKSDYEATAIFTVHTPIHFNNIISRNLLGPCHLSDEESVSCCCWGDEGSIRFDMYLDTLAYIPGDTIKPRLECTNMSTTNVSSLDTKVKMKIKTVVELPTTKTRKDTELVATESIRGVGAHGKRNEHLQLKIPSDLPVYNFEGSKLFSQMFYIEATCQVEGCCPNIDLGGVIHLGHTREPSSTEEPLPPPPPMSDSSESELLPPHMHLPHMPSSSPRAPSQQLPPPYMPLLMPSAPIDSSIPNAPSVDNNRDLDGSTLADSHMPPPSYDEAMKSSFIPDVHPTK